MGMVPIHRSPASYLPPMKYKSLSPEAKAIAELLNTPLDAEFASRVLERAAEVLRNAYANEAYPDHPDDFLFDLARELKDHD